MPKRVVKGIDVRISEMPNLAGQLRSDFAFSRRVNEEYVVPSPRDSMVEAEGLHPCVVVPEYDLGKTLAVIYKKPMTYLNPAPGDLLFKESARGFEQEVVKRFIIPKEGKMYYSESEWMHDTSPEGLYPTLIFPKELVGKVVTLLSTIE